MDKAIFKLLSREELNKLSTQEQLDYMHAHMRELRRQLDETKRQLEESKAILAKLGTLRPPDRGD